MFFPKLRRRAKWVFLFLALIFAFSFVFFGVGAGGSGIGDYISDLFNRPVSSDTPELDDAQKAATENPNDPGAQLELARAAQAEGQTQVAISAYEKYRTMRPEDPDALRTLAALYGAQIAAAQQRAAVASGQAAEASLPKTLAPEDSQFLQELTTNPLTASLSAQAQARADAASADVQRLGFAQVAVFSKLTELVKDDPPHLPPVRERRGDCSGLPVGDQRLRVVPRPAAQQPERRAGSTANRHAESGLRHAAGGCLAERIGRRVGQPVERLG